MRNEEARFEELIREQVEISTLREENRVMRKLLERLVKVDEEALKGSTEGFRQRFSVACDDILDDTREFLDSTK